MSVKTISKDYEELISETIEVKGIFDIGIITGVTFPKCNMNDKVCIHYTFWDSPGTVDFTFTELGDYTVYVEGSNDNGYSKSEEITIHVITLGDCNGDGEFNVSDVVLLQKWLLAVPDTHFVNWKAADFCEDGRLDVFDLCLMKRKLING